MLVVRGAPRAREAESGSGRAQVTLARGRAGFPCAMHSLTRLPHRGVAPAAKVLLVASVVSQPYRQLEKYCFADATT